MIVCLRRQSKDLPRAPRRCSMCIASVLSSLLGSVKEANQLSVEEHGMASMMAPPGETTVPTRQGTLNPSRNPLPLSASQEGQVRELYHKRVRTKCADEVRGKHGHHMSYRYQVDPSDIARSSRLRSLRHLPHLHSNTLLPERAESDEHVYDEVRDAGGA